MKKDRRPPSRCGWRAHKENLDAVNSWPLGKSSNCTEGDTKAKKKQKKVRVNPHVPAKLATTAATSVDRKAEAVRRPKIPHSVQRQPTVGKLATKLCNRPMNMWM